MESSLTDTSILFNMRTNTARTNSHHVCLFECLHLLLEFKRTALLIKSDPEPVPLPYEVVQHTLNSLSFDIYTYSEYVKTPAGGMGITMGDYEETGTSIQKIYIFSIKISPAAPVF